MIHAFAPALNKENRSNSQIPSKLSDHTMLCAKFQDSLWIEFGSVSLGTTNKKRFTLLNPNDTKSVLISIEKIPTNMGFTLMFDAPHEEQQAVNVQPNQSCSGTIYWIPLFDVSLREIITFKMDERASLQIVLHGSAGTGQVWIKYFLHFFVQ